MATNYDKTIGTNPWPDFKGTMRIKDLGSVVELWIRAGSTNTMTYKSGYSWTLNGKSGSGTFSYQKGKKWMRLRSATLLYSQTVTFKIAKTGTEGLGGPYTHTAYIDRASARVRHGGTWRTAIPYVRVSGTWKMAQAYIRQSGSWKKGG